MDNVLIGICGGTGSGKTTLAQRVASSFEGDVLLISMDNYYKANENLSFEERTHVNYDHPDTFDSELLIKHLSMLKEGKAVEMPVYDFSNYTRKSATITTPPKKVIVIEGILLFAMPEIVDLLDIRIFVDTDADVRILRRLMRDVKERGRNLDSVVNQYLQTVKPMHEAFIEPSKKYADIIVPRGGYNTNAFSMIVSLILDKLRN